jgi:hypothetical protein
MTEVLWCPVRSIARTAGLQRGRAGADKHSRHAGSVSSAMRTTRSGQPLVD